MQAVRGTHSLEVPVTLGGKCLVSCEVCGRFITAIICML